MRLRPAKFRVGDGVSLAGKAMRVAGVVQYEDAGGVPVTRYLLAELAGAPAVLEETAQGFALLGTFPADAQPTASGNSVSVLGERYTLQGLRKLKLVGTDGRPPGGPPKGDLLLSGEFTGSMGTLVREIVPGLEGQRFFLLKRLAAEDVLSNDEIAARLDAGRRDAEIRAAEEDEPRGRGRLQMAVVAAVAVIVAAALVYSCVSAEGEAPAGGARSAPHAR